MAVQTFLASPDAPGRPLQHADPRLAGMKQSFQSGDEAKARANFAVLELAVRAIEWLQVDEGEQQRAIMHAATHWSVQPLAP